MKTYVSAYCNFPHNVGNGRPVGHECRVIPIRALWAEIDGKYATANEILRTSDPRLVKGEVKS